MIEEGADGDALTEYDLMARLAYAIPLSATIPVYDEFLPGYSVISQPRGENATGFVLACGVGGMMDFTKRAFVSLGIGYQVGLQTVPRCERRHSELQRTQERHEVFLEGWTARTKPSNVDVMASLGVSFALFR